MVAVSGKEEKKGKPVSFSKVVFDARRERRKESEFSSHFLFITFSQLMICANWITQHNLPFLSNIHALSRPLLCRSVKLSGRYTHIERDGSNCRFRQSPTNMAEREEGHREINEESGVIDERTCVVSLHLSPSSFPSDPLSCFIFWYSVHLIPCTSHSPVPVLQAGKRREERYTVTPFPSLPSLSLLPESITFQEWFKTCYKYRVWGVSPSLPILSVSSLSLNFSDSPSIHFVE